jgi:hypothetical protein
MHRDEPVPAAAELHDRSEQDIANLVTACGDCALGARTVACPYSGQHSLMAENLSRRSSRLLKMLALRALLASVARYSDGSQWRLLRPEGSK